MALNHATSPVGDFSVFKRIKKFYAELRREFVTKSTSGGCGQFETSPEAIEPQLLKLLCERRQTDLKGHCPDDTYFLTYPTLARLRVQPVPIQRVASASWRMRVASERYAN